MSTSEYKAEAVDNTYKGLRLVGKDHDLYYSVWFTNEHELYNMTMTNLFADGFVNNGSCGGGPLTKLAVRLDVLKLVLKTCQGDACRNSWGQLDVSGKIASLADALQPEYDNLFENQLPRVSFSECMPGYFPSAEGPQFSSGLVKREGSFSDPNWAMRT